MPLTPLLANDDIKSKLSQRLARLSMQDMQRDGGSTNNEPEIDVLRRIEILLQNPETYKVLDYPTHTIIDHLVKYGVIEQDEASHLLEQMTGQPSKGRLIITKATP